VIDYLNDSPQNRGRADLERAQKFAQRARELAPQRAETQTAIFFTRFYDLHFDDAFQAAREAVGLNPNSSLLMARIARAYITRERYDDGLALMAPFESANVSPPSSMLAPLAIASIMHGDSEKALSYAMRTATTATPLGLVARIVACRESGDGACAVAAQNELKTVFPGFAKDVPAALQRHAYTDSIRARLLKGLVDAGWTADGAATEPSHGNSIKQ
jgi:hypothetical protein